MDHCDLTNKINNLVRDTTAGEIADIIDGSAIEKDLFTVRDKLENGEDFPITTGRCNFNDRRNNNGYNVRVASENSQSLSGGGQDSNKNWNFSVQHN